MKQKPLLIKIYRDGNQWCALIGQDLQNGYAGFDCTIVGAIRALCNDIEGLVDTAFRSAWSRMDKDDRSTI